MKLIFGVSITIFLFILVVSVGCIDKELPDSTGSASRSSEDLCIGNSCHHVPAGCGINTNYASKDPPCIPTREIIPPPKSQVSAKATSQSTPADRDGLLVWYDFEDDFTRAGYVTDKSGNNRNAGIKGNVTSASGIHCVRSIRFSGRGYILAPDNPAALRKDITFSFWFRTENPDANYKMASAALWNGGPGSGWTMATHVPEFWADDNEGVLVPAQPNKPNHFIPGQWNFEAVTYDGKNITEYTNGNLINSWESRGVPLGEGTPMAIGGWPQFQGYNFIGDLDDFRIYDHALQPGELSAIYARELE